ncbi:MAG: fumarylacetoacetate hydrolase family protein [Pseudomonadota bacterium]
MFSLATLKVAGKPVPAIRIQDSYWALADVAPELIAAQPLRGMMNLFDDWAKSEAVLLPLAEALAAGRNKAAPLPAPAGPADILSPLLYPNKLVLGGANYYDHMRLDAKRESYNKADYIPIFFLKPPTTTLVGGGPVVQYPPDVQRFDYEIEFAAVIGKRVRHLTLENALDCVAAYTIALDMSARDLQRNPRHMANFDLFNGKCFDSACPLGPGIVPARFIDPANTPLKLWVNGELRQDSNTSQMIWSLAEQLVDITKYVTLEPGDVVSTGTPAGTALLDGRYLKVGDTIDCEAGLLGRLSVSVVEPE